VLSQRAATRNEYWIVGVISQSSCFNFTAQAARWDSEPYPVTLQLEEHWMDTTGTMSNPASPRPASGLNRPWHDFVPEAGGVDFRFE